MLENSNNDIPLISENFEYLNYSQYNFSYSRYMSIKKNKCMIKKKELINHKNYKSAEHSKKRKIKIELIEISEQNNINKRNNELIAPENLEIETFGFENIGNSCYMNSFLSILIHTQNFIKELKSSKKVNNELIKNLIELSENKNNKENLRKIKNIMGEKDKSYSENCQNDSQRFGIDLLDKLISIIKNESENESSDDEESDSNEGNLSELKKEKLNRFQAFKNYNLKKENSLEKMFLLYEFQVEIESELNKFRKIRFEQNLNININISGNSAKYDLNELLNKKYCRILNEAPINDEIEEESKIEIIVQNEKTANEPSNSKIQEQNGKFCCDKFCFYIKYYILICLFSIHDCFYSFLNCIYLFILIPLFPCCRKSQSNNIINKQENKTKKYAREKRIINLPKILIITINRAIIEKKFNTSILHFEKSLNINQYLDSDFPEIANKNTEYILYAINVCIGNSEKSGHFYSYINIKDQWIQFSDENVIKNAVPSFDSKYVVGLFYIKKK